MANLVGRASGGWLGYVRTWIRVALARFLMHRLQGASSREIYKTRVTDAKLGNCNILRFSDKCEP